MLLSCSCVIIRTLSIKFRGDSSSDLDVVKEVLQSLSILEKEDVTIIKKAGGDIKIKATINKINIYEHTHPQHVNFEKRILKLKEKSGMESG